MQLQQVCHLSSETQYCSQHVTHKVQYVIQHAEVWRVVKSGLVASLVYHTQLKATVKI